MPMTSLPIRLRALRGAKGWTLEEAAVKVGITADNLSKAERGHSHPRVSTLNKLARAYGVNVEELMMLEEPLAAGKAEAPHAGRPAPKETSVEPPRDPFPTTTYDYEDVVAERNSLRAENAKLKAQLAEVLASEREEIVIHDATGQVTAVVEGTSGQSARVAREIVQDVVGQAVGQVSDAAGEALGQVQDTAGEAAAQVQDATGTAAEQAQDVAGRLSSSARKKNVRNSN